MRKGSSKYQKPEVVAYIAKRYAEYATQTEIAREIGASQKVVFQVMQREGIAARRKGERAGRRKLKLLDLFSGIGGFSLGLERSGFFQTVAFCEIEEFPRRVLAKHWPEVPRYDDVRTLTAKRLAADGIFVDAICGGFPCQDISEAGRREGIEGERSGLWREFARIIGELRPRIVLVENVAALLGRGMGTVLGDLASVGYDAEWHCIPAGAVGAPHERDRVWIIAYPNQSKWREIISSCDRMAWFDTLPQREESPSRSKGFPKVAWGDDAVMVADSLSGMDDGVSIRMDGFNGCANAVVPQIPEIIGRAIGVAILNGLDVGFAGGMRKCVKCGEIKPSIEFYGRSDKGGWNRRKECSTCFLEKNRGWHKRNSERKSELSRKWRAKNPERHAAYGRKHKYGITKEKYELMLSRQGGQCAICKGVDNNRLSVDHCHKTGVVRGLLCGNCNRMIGLAKEDASILAGAIEYVSSFKCLQYESAE